MAILNQFSIGIYYFLGCKDEAKKIGGNRILLYNREHCNGEIVIFSIQTSFYQINGELSMNKEEVCLAVQCQ